MTKQIQIRFHPVEPFAEVMVAKAREFYNEKPELIAEIKNKLKIHDKALRTFMINMN